MAERVDGNIVSWEELFEDLNGSASAPDHDLDRLRHFYSAMTYGTNLLVWPEGVDVEGLRRIRTARRQQLDEFAG
ncbi:hypothetical protein [Brevibacterium sp.]|uniref:hypothetical protein n=1 Tax=Brevibacterium sp. TaxID=1701 RepID=UPI00281203A9|nr:hypothetical protein [Brevibacterium sp.]